MAKKKTTKKRPNKPKHQKTKLNLSSARIHGNKEKHKIAVDMLERYTGHDFKDFQKQIILTNFQYYIERFNILLDDAKMTKGSAFRASSSKKSKIILVRLNFIYKHLFNR